MEKWKRENGVLNNDGMVIAKKNVDNIVALWPSPGLRLPTFAMAETGILILAVLPHLQAAGKALQREETIKVATTGKWTLDEETKLHATMTHLPTGDYNALKLNITSYCALIWALFGDQCNFYIQLMQMLWVMHHPNVVTL